MFLNAFAQSPGRLLDVTFCESPRTANNEVSQPIDLGKGVLKRYE